MLLSQAEVEPDREGRTPDPGSASGPLSLQKRFTSFSKKSVTAGAYEQRGAFEVVPLAFLAEF